MFLNRLFFDSASVDVERMKPVLDPAPVLFHRCRLPRLEKASQAAANHSQQKELFRRPAGEVPRLWRTGIANQQIRNLSRQCQAVHTSGKKVKHRILSRMARLYFASAMTSFPSSFPGRSCAPHLTISAEDSAERTKELTFDEQETTHASRDRLQVLPGWF